MLGVNICQKLKAASTAARTCGACDSDRRSKALVLSQRNWVRSSDHLHVIAEEVSRVEELCIGQDMETMRTAMAFMNMEAGSAN